MSETDYGYSQNKNEVVNITMKIKLHTCEIQSRTLNSIYSMSWMQNNSQTTMKRQPGQKNEYVNSLFGSVLNQMRKNLDA